MLPKPIVTSFNLANMPDSIMIYIMAAIFSVYICISSKSKVGFYLQLNSLGHIYKSPPPYNTWESKPQTDPVIG